MLPSNVLRYLDKMERPENRNDSRVKDFETIFEILTYDEAKKILEKIGIKSNTDFYDYYYNFLPSGAHFKDDADLLYDLEEIYEDFLHPFWTQYPEIGGRYLQISSIEGEYSYFYDKTTGAVYDVDWVDMDKFLKGDCEPRWKTFRDFLEWYYSDA